MSLSAINRLRVASGRAMEVAHPRSGGGTLFGVPGNITVHAEWAAWAKATAVPELDLQETFSKIPNEKLVDLFNKKNDKIKVLIEYFLAFLLLITAILIVLDK